MVANPNKLSQFWHELKRRKVVRVITVYAAAAFVILEAVDIIFPRLNFPDWTVTFVMILLAVGFPVALIFSWIFDVTPEGIEKTKPAHEVWDREKTNVPNSWRIATYVSIVVIVGLVVLNIFSNRIGTKNESLETSIAVLPFENMSVDEEYSHMGDAITDEIILELQKIKEFDRVLSRTSTMQYKDNRPTIPEIAEKLGVNYIIEGSIQRHKEDVSIRVQVIRAQNEDHVWADEYNGKWEDIFSIQDDIALKVAYELKTVLTPEEIEQIDKQPTVNPGAYNLYLRGRNFWDQRTEVDLKKSVYYFNQAIELDSTYALAYAGLADSYSIMTWYGWYPIIDGYAKGKEFAQKALSINRNIAEAHATLGYIATYYDWNWEEAERELKMAIFLNPNYATTYQYYAELLDILGKNKEARDQIEKALKLSPNTNVVNVMSAILFYHNSDFRKSIETYQKVLENVYGFNIVRGILQCYLSLGMDHEAIEQMKKIISVETPNIDPEHLDEIYQQSGMEEVLRWFIDWVAQNKLASNYNIASFYAMLEDSDLVIDYLEKGFDLGEGNILRINSNPDFNYLKPDPRFQSFIKKIGLD